MKGTPYLIISKPDRIALDCPHCKAEIEVDYAEVQYFDARYWSKGGLCTCPNCYKEIQLGDYDYD